MPSVCFYFQVHQPSRLRRYGVFDVGRRHDYFDARLDEAIVRKVAARCYRPMNQLLLELVERHAGRFRCAFSISGSAIEQLERWAPEVIESFQALARSGCVEILGETYYHSLSFLASADEFHAQVQRHREKVTELFGTRPAVFRNTELIYADALAPHVERLGFRGVLAEGADAVLGWRSPNFVYAAPGDPDVRLLLKNYRLSDDIAFRFGDRNWEGHPLSAEKFAGWIHAVNGCGDLVNLFMDYETFGEHQWESTGIFEFMRRLPDRVLEHVDGSFVTPSEAIASYAPAAELSFPRFTSWADAERDLTAWLGNAMQASAHRSLYELRDAVMRSGDADLIEDWRRLTTSDHFYYMCTKWFSDGDVHKYFSPYESPYEAHIGFLNALADLALRAGA
ncbi:MAG: alpha-amylase [Deltaproteobacteria bacterium]|nr:MAG: alpha-amylase [Deltaproteobacteria bacterium]